MTDEERNNEAQKRRAEATALEYFWEMVYPGGTDAEKRSFENGYYHQPRHKNSSKPELGASAASSSDYSSGGDYGGYSTGGEPVIGFGVGLVILLGVTLAAIVWCNHRTESRFQPEPYKSTFPARQAALPPRQPPFHRRNSVCPQRFAAARASGESKFLRWLRRTFSSDGSAPAQTSRITNRLLGQSRFGRRSHKRIL